MVCVSIGGVSHFPCSLRADDGKAIYLWLWSFTIMQAHISRVERRSPFQYPGSVWNLANQTESFLFSGSYDSSFWRLVNGVTCDWLLCPPHIQWPANSSSTVSPIYLLLFTVKLLTIGLCNFTSLVASWPVGYPILSLSSRTTIL